ncbi:hypothetical protein M758_2G235700 [Ceratodon purpureus]|nr:hypothetical protein M758_2G235700 [Ceratodon purpureus]
MPLLHYTDRQRWLCLSSTLNGKSHFKSSQRQMRPALWRASLQASTFAAIPTPITPTMGMNSSFTWTIESHSSFTGTD